MHTFQADLLAARQRGEVTTPQRERGREGGRERERGGGGGG